MFKELSQSIRDYAKNQSTNLKKRYYNDIADALDNEEFLQTLSNTETLDRLKYLQNDFNYGISRTSNFNDALNTVYISYATYIAESKQIISKFSQKLEILKRKFKRVKKE